MLRRLPVSLLRSGMGGVLLVFLLVILLPLSVYTVFQAVSSASAEEEADELYRQQLETVLFSVNQNSEDVTANLTSRINGAYLRFSSVNELAGRLQQIVNETGFISSISIIDSLGKETVTVPSGLMPAASVETYTLITGSAAVKRLYEYIQSGYRKVETFSGKGDEMNFVFVADSHDGTHALCIITFSLQKYIGSVLGPKIRTVAGSRYSMLIRNSRSGVRVFNHGEGNFTPDAVKPLWLLSDYEIGIKASGVTLTDAVKERTAMNLRLLILLNLSLMIGAFLIGYIIRREMKLTKLKSDFVANVSHELRTPLSLISMFSESLMLGRVKSDEKRNEYYRIIHGETDRLSGMVNKILSFSKMEAGKKTYTFAELSLTHHLSRIYNSYEYHLEQKGFTSELILPEDEVIVSGDEHALEEVIINLLDNAIKYSTDKKFVSVVLKTDESKALLSVTDRGIGISKEDQKRVFEKFFRAGSSEVHTTKGTGLGLSIVRQIVEAHKGEITVLSEQGKGSTFTVILPLIQ